MATIPVLDPDQALLIHAALPIDANPILAHPETGLYLDNIDFAPSRQESEKLDHSGRIAAILYAQAKYELTMEGDVVAKADVAGLRHPGTALALASVANYGPDVAMGFPTTNTAAYWIVKQPGLQGRQGDFYRLNTVFRLFFLSEQGVSIGGLPLAT